MGSSSQMTATSFALASIRCPQHPQLSAYCIALRELVYGDEDSHASSAVTQDLRALALAIFPTVICMDARSTVLSCA